VLESLDFEYNDPPNQNLWRCILGGAQQLALNMAAQLKQGQPKTGSRVTAIRALTPTTMQIDVAGAPVATTYHGVFNSTTLGCLGRIDTTGVNLPYAVREATRVLSYGPSAKVGILFDHAWWKFDLNGNSGSAGSTDYNITTGGLGHSDLNLRTVVYPSYNGDVVQGQPAVLLCSYTWQQDALRLGSLMSSSLDHATAVAEEEANGLKDLLIRELARLHASSAVPEAQLADIISKSWQDHYAHDWTHDPNCSGAFAFFGASQFSTLWGDMIQPAGNLVVVGEATSPHHAWVVGALESAVYGVYAWLKLREGDIQGASAALGVLATPVSGNPFVGLPDYMEENTAAWAAILGNFAEEEYFAARKPE
jgi:monoamine oxidase